MMTVEERIRRCILIEKMSRQKAYSEKIGLEDTSKLHDKKIDKKEEREIC